MFAYQALDSIVHLVDYDPCNVVLLTEGVEGAEMFGVVEPFWTDIE